MATLPLRRICVFVVLVCLAISLMSDVAAEKDKAKSGNATKDARKEGKAKADSKAKATPKKAAEPKKPLARMDARVAVGGDDAKEIIPKKEALLRAELTQGEISPPPPDSHPGLSEMQREMHRCRDSNNDLHALGATFLTYGIECTYYECEYNTDINAVSWMLSRDIYKCCFEDQHGYKAGAVLRGKCSKKVCMRDGEDNPFHGSLGWEVHETGCKQCAIGLVMLDHDEMFHTGDPCLSFHCGTDAKLKQVVDKKCCRLNDRYIADGQLAMTRVENVCEVAICKAGRFTNHTNYQQLIKYDEYVSGCWVNWSQIQGTCYHSFTKPKTLEDTAKHCSTLAPARNSRLMEVDFGGMIGTMSDVMELGRWYWLLLRTRSKTPRYMWSHDETTPERFLVGHHAQPTVKKVNNAGKLVFQRSESERNAYVCQMDHQPSCKPTGYTERPPIDPLHRDRNEF